MVYNEGFEFRFNNNSPDYERYFVFSKYGANTDPSNYSTSSVSYCHQTLVGWYNIGNRWGCFYGNKQVPNPNEITNGDTDNKQTITENSILFMEKNAKTNSFLSITKYSRFAQTSNSDELLLDANFTNHSKLVERLNSANLTWKAREYKEFEGYSRGQLKKMSGTLKITNNSKRKKKIKKKILNQLSKKSNSNSLSICPILNNNENLKLDDLPDNFDVWEKFMTTPGSQVI